MKGIPSLILAITLFSLPAIATDYSVGHGPGFDFATVADALAVARSGDRILLSGGTYSLASNERFPLQMQQGVVLMRATPTDQPIIDASGARQSVIYCKGLKPGTVIDGMLITGGDASGPGPGSYGGGIFLDDSSILIENCVIEQNQANENGGGISCISKSSPTIQNCEINYNVAVGFGGGGIFCDEYSAPTISDCLVTNNKAGYGGGGIMCYLYDCDAKITNCTVSLNQAVEGAGLWCDFDSSPVVTNCIFWDNGNQEIYTFFSTPIVTYCDVEGSYICRGNLKTDPQFVDALNGDFHLKSTSPCIDSGDPLGAADPDGTRADIGVYFFDQSSGGFMLGVNPDPLVAGQSVDFLVKYGLANSPTYLGYSLAGLGSTPIPPLNVTAGLDNPSALAGPTATDATGSVSWTINVPPPAAGMFIWFQALQMGQATNVVATKVL